MPNDDDDDDDDKRHIFISSPKHHDLLWDPPSLTLDACSIPSGDEMA